MVGLALIQGLFRVYLGLVKGLEFILNLFRVGLLGLGTI